MPIKRKFVSHCVYAPSENDMRRMLDACGDLSDRIMLLLASRYGFRREDVVNIRVRDIVLDKEPSITFYERKKKRNRTIPIEVDVAGELRRYIATLPKNSEFLLKVRDGSTCWIHLQKIAEIAGVKSTKDNGKFPFHSLRGYCIKQRQKAGWTVNECAALLGDSVDIVSRHYLTTSASELRTLMKGKKQEGD